MAGEKAPGLEDYSFMFLGKCRERERGRVWQRWKEESGEGILYEGEGKEGGKKGKGEKGK